MSTTPSDFQIKKCPTHKAVTTVTTLDHYLLGVTLGESYELKTTVDRAGLLQE